jgi:hypothetical protein
VLFTAPSAFFFFASLSLCVLNPKMRLQLSLVSCCISRGCFRNVSVLFSLSLFSVLFCTSTQLFGFNGYRFMYLPDVRMLLPSPDDVIKRNARKNIFLFFFHFLVPKEGS